MRMIIVLANIITFCISASATDYVSLLDGRYCGERLPDGTPPTCDSASELQAGLDAVGASGPGTWSGRTLRLPCGEVVIEDTVTIQDVYGLTIEGCGAGFDAGNEVGGTVVRWKTQSIESGNVFSIFGNIRNLTFRNFAVACGGDTAAGEKTAASAFVLDALSAQPNQTLRDVKFSNVAIYECSGSSVKLTSPNDHQLDNVYFENMLWTGYTSSTKPVATCLEVDSLNALNVQVVNSRCDYSDVGFKLSAGDFALQGLEIVTSHPSASAAVEIGAKWRPSSIRETIFEILHGDGVVSSGESSTSGYQLTIADSQIRIKEPAGDAINWQHGGELVVTNSLITGLTGNQSIGLVIDPATPRDLFLTWQNNFFQHGTLIQVDYADAIDGDVIPLTQSITHSTCTNLPADKFLQGTVCRIPSAGFRGKVCSPSGDDFCDAAVEWVSLP